MPLQTESKNISQDDFQKAQKTLSVFRLKVPFVLDNLNELDYVDEKILHRLKKLLVRYGEDPTTENYLKLLYSIPSGLELTDHIVTNYGQLKTMWYQRHNHRLPEWRMFCDWILTLPKFSELTGIEKEKNNADN